MRHKLENDCLAPCLRGRVRYFVTWYVGTHDYEGRAAILVDGEEALSGGYFEAWPKDLLLGTETPEEIRRNYYEGLNV